jgi:GNAT superfamily N-acetyltransferase
MNKRLSFQISSVGMADIDALSRVQILADRRMDVLMEVTSKFNPLVTDENISGHKNVWTAYFNTQAEKPDLLYQGLKAEFEGALIGCVFTCTETCPPKIAPKTLVGRVDALFVHPDYWHKGIARQLMDAASQGLKEKNVRYAALWADRYNEVLNDVYQGLGWTRRPACVMPMTVNGRQSSVVLFDRRL